jgi:hypothetical protein
MAPAPAETTTSLRAPKVLTKAGTRFLCIIHQAAEIARLDGAENERRADGDGDDMDDGGDVMAKGNDTEIKAHPDAGCGGLVDHIADEEGQKPFCLVFLHAHAELCLIVGFTQNDGHARDVARHQRYAQGADDRVGHKADAPLILVGLRAVDKFEALQDFRADGCGEARVQSVSKVLFVRDEAFQDADAGGQIAELRDLDARRGVNRGEEVCRIGEGNLRLRAVFGNGVVDGALRQSGDRV